MFKTRDECIQKYLREPQNWEKSIRNSCSWLGVPGIWAGGSWKCFTYFSHTTKYHTSEIVLDIWNIQKRLPVARPNGSLQNQSTNLSLKKKKMLDKHFILNKCPTRNTFLATLNNIDIYKTTTPTDQSILRFWPIWTNNPYSHFWTRKKAMSNRALQNNL